MQIPTATPQDPLDHNNLFYSDLLPFIAAALLSNDSVQIVKVIPHPVKLGGIKLFYLSPKDICEELYTLYRAGQLKAVDVQAHTHKIHEVKNLPFTEETSSSSTPINMNIPEQRKKGLIGGK